MEELGGRTDFGPGLFFVARLRGLLRGSKGSTGWTEECESNLGSPSSPSSDEIEEDDEDEDFFDLGIEWDLTPTMRGPSPSSSSDEEEE